MDNSCIFWFSGTGNSLHAAKRLSGELGGIPLAQITDEPPADAVGGEGAKIGFVFPSYFGNMPR
ncbi:MAG: 4Fe-4S ferredoxin, partial [Oscillospiraceae bacterium]|nr:4Fe-4S ferredoxin [Oscillospiraceae bacterium]